MCLQCSEGGGVLRLVCNLWWSSVPFRSFFSISVSSRRHHPPAEPPRLPVAVVQWHRSRPSSLFPQALHPDSSSRQR